MTSTCHQTRRLRSFLACLLLPLFWWGCAGGGTSSSTVSGTVTLDGQPVGSGTVLLISSSGEAASDALTPEGTYEIHCLPGDYQIAVSPPPPADPMIKTAGPVVKPIVLIPNRYQDVSTSGLQKKVAPGVNTIHVELLSKATPR